MWAMLYFHHGAFKSDEVRFWEWSTGTYPWSKHVRCIAWTLGCCGHVMEALWPSAGEWQSTLFSEYCAKESETSVLCAFIFFSHTLFLTSSWHLRTTLVEHGFFGDPASDFKVLLIDAWQDYRAWCKANGVYAGQGRFTPGLVAGHFQRSEISQTCTCTAWHLHVHWS